jgi:hypothetical protein
MRGSAVNNTTLFRKMLYSNEWNYMFRPAVAVFSFPQTIKMSLYNLCDGVLMKRSLCINPLFARVSSINRSYSISNEEVFSISSVEIGITVQGLHELLWQSLVYCILSLSFWADPLCRWPWWIWLCSCGGEEKKTSVWEGCVLDFIIIYTYLLVLESASFGEHKHLYQDARCNDKDCSLHTLSYWMQLYVSVRKGPSQGNQPQLYSMKSHQSLFHTADLI